MLKLETKNTGIKSKPHNKHIVSFINTDNLKEIQLFAIKARAKWNEFVIVGMGGSIMGAKTLYETLGSDKKVEFIDNLTSTIKLNHNALYVFASKSGSTLETISIYKYLKPKPEHTVIITSNTNGALYLISKKKNIQIFLMPKEISGRFSIFTACGLLPAALMGINIKNLLEGALKISSTDLPASLAYIQYKLKKRAIVPFVYANNFNAFLEWYKQLLAESLGKNSHIGADPITAIGPKDQHSLLQLLQAGPKDKFVIFIEVQGAQNTLMKIIAAELKATEKVMKQKNAKIIIPKMDEEHIGQLLYLFMAQIALLGDFYGVNAFNQPGVETGKKLTQKILG